MMLRMREAKAKNQPKGAKAKKPGEELGKQRMRKANATKSRINQRKAAKAKTLPAGEPPKAAKTNKKTKSQEAEKPRSQKRGTKLKTCPSLRTSEDARLGRAAHISRGTKAATT